nr:type II toxin-antitoxin system PemK/MazF family toxin [Anaerocolumna cellulosilytica]
MVAYWIETYSHYLLNEERFDYTRVLKFNRGDIVSINFGFNVASEQGGLHYAIVLDNDNKHTSPVITVLPLSSGTETDVHERDVYLGNELYEKLKQKHNSLSQKIKSERDEVLQLLVGLQKSITLIGKENITGQEAYNNLEVLINETKEKKANLDKEYEIFLRYEREINKLKSGSIALMEQITTISKMRIYTPKNSMDLLYGIKFSNPAMNKINDNIKKLFLYENKC